MKNSIVFLTLVIALFAFGCNNDSGSGSKSPEELAVDTLKKQIDDKHIEGMAKMGRLTRLQQQAERVLDSLDKLPATAKPRLAEYRLQLDSVLSQLNYADYAMNRWMPEYYQNDTSFKQIKDQINYLQNEKSKAGKVTDAILRSIRRADSVFVGK